MPYDKYVEEHPHLASFVASVNGNDFLTDPTGSRRFLPFEVLSIDIERAKAISMDAVYTEAKALLNGGFRYWFDDDEIAELYQESEDFQVQTAEMELLLRCFEKSSEDNPHCKRKKRRRNAKRQWRTRNVSKNSNPSSSVFASQTALSKSTFWRVCRNIWMRVWQCTIVCSTMPTISKRTRLSFRRPLRVDG